MLGIRHWSTDTWTAIAAIVAFAALIQPWLVTVWKKTFKRGTIDIYETPTAEICFSALGATIGLTGTLRSRDRDMFIQMARLTFGKNGTTRHFHWTAFRTPKISVGTTAGQSAEVSMDAPYSFMILMLEPHRFNIMFSDTRLLQEAQPKVEKLRQEWIASIQSIEVPELPLDPSVQRNLIKKLRRAHVDFSKRGNYQETLTFLEDVFPWKAGTYDLTLHIITARPDRTYRRTWKVTFSELEIANLRNNISFALEEALGLPLVPGVYSFIQTPLNKPK
ncbi:MAG: hypothetical protein QOH71_3440 [Blastocatellia bacterium]|jgi:hypothetical protein|nr:hypothetical protein [Blastocatellia bacterium]